AAQAELELKQREAEEMKRRYREADVNRFALLAQLRSAGARDRMRSRMGTEEGPGADWSRMEERVNDNTAYADALEEFAAEDRPPPKPRSDPNEIEERLLELKRRLGQE